jgi:hypothetical protein
MHEKPNTRFSIGQICEDEYEVGTETHIAFQNEWVDAK